MLTLENKVESMAEDMSVISAGMQRLLQNAGLGAPAASAPARAAPTLLDRYESEDSDGEELQQVPPAQQKRLHRDDLQSLTNGNVGRLHPEMDAAARAMAADGAGVLASGVPSGGQGMGKHISDLPCAPLLENAVRGRAGRQGAVVAVIGDGNQIQFMQAAGELGGGRKQLPVKQLLETIPNPFVFAEAVRFRKQSLINTGHLHGDELLHYERVYEPQLIQLAKQFVGGQQLLSGDEFLRGWQAFVEFEREVTYVIYELRLSFADVSAHLMGSLMHEALSKRAVGKVSRASGGASGSSKGGSSGGGGRGGGAGGSGSGGASELAAYLLEHVPEEHRTACCIPFWKAGKCPRPSCTHAAGHKCLLCGSTSHGGAQCPRA
jgi:hypothetical protein